MNESNEISTKNTFNVVKTLLTKYYTLLVKNAKLVFLQEFVSLKSGGMETSYEKRNKTI